MKILTFPCSAAASVLRGLVRVHLFRRLKRLAVTRGKTPTLECQGLACRSWVWFCHNLGLSPGFCFPARQPVAQPLVALCSLQLLLQLVHLHVQLLQGAVIFTFIYLFSSAVSHLYGCSHHSASGLFFWLGNSLSWLTYGHVRTGTLEKMAAIWMCITLICSGFQGAVSSLNQNLLGPDCG